MEIFPKVVSEVLYGKPFGKIIGTVIRGSFWEKKERYKCKSSSGFYSRKKSSGTHTDLIFGSIKPEHVRTTYPNVIYQNSFG